MYQGAEIALACVEQALALCGREITRAGNIYAGEGLNAGPFVVSLDASLLLLAPCMIEGSLQPGKAAIGRGLTLPHILRVVEVCAAVGLLVSVLGTLAGGQPGNLPMPLPDLACFELVDGLIPEGGNGKGIQPELCVIRRWLIPKVIYVRSNGLLDGVCPDLARAKAASGLLRLPEVKNGLAVGILSIVGDGDGLNFVLLLALILTDAPGAAALALAVADMEALADRAPVGLAAGLELAASLTAI